MTHPTWELKIQEGQSALLLTPCPGTKETDLPCSIEQLRKQGVQAVVTALEFDEMAKAGVSELPKKVQELGMVWIHLPIEDDCAPGEYFASEWKKVSPTLHKIINQGGKVAIHCMGGSGRTGMLAAHLLLELGWDLKTIKSKIKALRPGAFTKTVQIEYITQLAAK